MRFKKIIAISMITAGTLIFLVLILGLLVPTSVLNKLSKNKPATDTAQVVTTTEDGKKVVETVNPSTGEKVVTVTDPTTGQTVTTKTSASGEKTTIAADGTTTTTPPSNGGTTPTTPTIPTTPTTPTTPTNPAVSKPVVSISVSPSTITSGASATLGWSATNSPTSCTASGGWSGTKAASGTQSVSPTSSTSYTLSCTNAGGSGSATASITVNAVVLACGQGGTCHSSDITGHSTSGDCRSAINKNGGGLAAYAIPSSFLSTHQPKKSITGTLCGKVYSANLRNDNGDHKGPTVGGSTYDTWMSNFYIGPYN